jgi:hypothetical protein
MIIILDYDVVFVIIIQIMMVGFGNLTPSTTNKMALHHRIYIKIHGRLFKCPACNYAIKQGWV